MKQSINLGLPPSYHYLGIFMNEHGETQYTEGSKLGPPIVGRWIPKVACEVPFVYTPKSLHGTQKCLQ